MAIYNREDARTALPQLEKKIDERTTDFIVEQGKSGVWSYRKWNSGTFDAWASFTSSVACNTASGSLYISAKQEVDLPAFTIVGKTNYPWSINASINGVESIWFETFPSSDATVAYRIVRTTSRTASNRNIKMSLVGKWK